MFFKRKGGKRGTEAYAGAGSVERNRRLPGDGHQRHGGRLQSRPRVFLGPSSQLCQPADREGAGIHRDIGQLIGTPQGGLQEGNPEWSGGHYHRP